jgi:sulfite exporter TauE/SafE
MLAFALGTVVALLGFSYGSAAALSQRRMWLANASRYGKPLFGGVLLLVGGFILSGLDRRLEVVLLDLLPQAWIGFITRF